MPGMRRWMRLSGAGVRATTLQGRLPAPAHPRFRFPGVPGSTSSQCRWVSPRHEPRGFGSRIRNADGPRRAAGRPALIGGVDSRVQRSPPTQPSAWLPCV